MTLQERHKEVASEYTKGWPMIRIRTKWGLTDRQIYRIVKRLGIPLRGWRERKAA